MHIGMIFVTLLLTANVIGEKPVSFGLIVLPAGVLLFPLTYLLGDIITEVYGFREARRIIWFGMLCNLFMAFMCRLAILAPAPESWLHQEAYTQILGNGSRLMAVSTLTYFIGEFINAYIVAKLKVKMQGKSFWLRALCGSWIGEGIETALFLPLAFYGMMSNDELLKFGLFYYSFKVVYAFCTVPLANKLVNILKRLEKTDHYDQLSDFSLLKPTY
jgi:uncharacterized integral membrane protein (TIGR00697 family)